MASDGSESIDAKRELEIKEVLAKLPVVSKDPEMTVKLCIVHTREVAPIVRSVNLVGIGAGVIFAIVGAFLVYIGNVQSSSAITLFGNQITTTSVGVASIFIGAVTAVMTVRRTFKTLDVAIRRPSDLELYNPRQIAEKKGEHLLSNASDTER